MECKEIIIDFVALADVTVHHVTVKYLLWVGYILAVISLARKVLHLVIKIRVI